MPRGNKENIMRYEIPSISLVEQQQIVDKIYEYSSRIYYQLIINTIRSKR